MADRAFLGEYILKNNNSSLLKKNTLHSGHTGNARKHEGTQGNAREREGRQGNTRESEETMRGNNARELRQGMRGNYIVH